MDTVVDARRRSVPPGHSVRVTTTLYDLIAALQATVPPEEDTRVVAAMTHLLRSGRLKVMPPPSTPQPQGRRSRRHVRVRMGYTTP